MNQCKTQGILSSNSLFLFSTRYQSPKAWIEKRKNTVSGLFLENAMEAVRGVFETPIRGHVKRHRRSRMERRSPTSQATKSGGQNPSV